jgi:predicted nucleotidyltransferase
MHHINEEITKIINVINQVTPANQILLFGSFAYGEPDMSSDIDLCIVIDDLSLSKRDVIKSIRKSITSIATMPVDLLVYSKEEFMMRVIVETTLEHKIAHEGVVVYEQ